MGTDSGSSLCPLSPALVCFLLPLHSPPPLRLGVEQVEEHPGSGAGRVGWETEWEKERERREGEEEWWEPFL